MLINVHYFHLLLSFNVQPTTKLVVYSCCCCGFYFILLINIIIISKEEHEGCMQPCGSEQSTIYNNTQTFKECKCGISKSIIILTYHSTILLCHLCHLPPQPLLPRHSSSPNLQNQITFISHYYDQIRN